MSKWWIGQSKPEEIDVEKEWPITWTFRFRSEAELKYFLGQLSDGWGENAVYSHFPANQTTREWLIDPTIDEYWRDDVD